MTTPTTPYLADAAGRTDLEDWGPLEEATAEPMQTAGLQLWADEATGQSAGIWECTAGPSRWLLETHEFIQLVAGSMTVTPDGGEPLKVGTGDCAFFPKGWSGIWDIHETLRKVYVIF
ncbi:MAG TPA: cupin domain-containing protein [Actinomycetes bacterium]|nr:cupin domain-containing protein [Actinomycetes bacterium]